MQRLQEEIQVDQASFFMLTPIPGSMDHFNAVKDGVPIDADLNLYDSFHPTMDHPNMTREQWFQAYRDAWQSFYSFDNMKAILSAPRRVCTGTPSRTWCGTRTPPSWRGNHPMMTGFFRLKGPHRTAAGHGHRQPLAILALARSRGAGLSQGVRALPAGTGGVVAANPQAQRARAASAGRPGADSREVQVLSNVRIADLQRAYAHAKLQVPSRLRLIAGEYNILSIRRITTRRELRQFWQHTKEQLRSGRLTKIRLHTMVCNVWRELKLHTTFAFSFAFNLMPARPRNTMAME